MIEYLAAFAQAPDSRHGYLRRHYSWGIPCEEALAVIAECSPRGVVEMGAGKGYWAMLLRERGVDVVAYDIDPRGEGEGPDRYLVGQPWTDVVEGGPDRVAEHPERTLLLCWPGPTRWTHEAIEGYGGDVVVFVGEPPSTGRTGSARMHELLATRFAEVRSVDVPRFPGMRDRLTVHQRIVPQGSEPHHG